MTTPTSLEPAATAPRAIPLVPLRDMVVFPRMMAPFVVGRASSIAALEAALATPEQNRLSCIGFCEIEEEDSPSPQPSPLKGEGDQGC